MSDVDTTVRIDNPDVQKQVKVQKRGSIHLTKDLAGERVEVVAKRVDETAGADIEAARYHIGVAMEEADRDVKDELRAGLAALGRVPDED